jgi:hypothetical protein
VSLRNYEARLPVAQLQADFPPKTKPTSVVCQEHRTPK